MAGFRVGIAGSGFGARVEAPMFAVHAGFEPVAIATLHRGDEARIREESGMHDVLHDWRRLLDRHLDLLVVAAHPALHREITEAALAQGLHVLCEKPMALDLAEAAAMEEARVRSGTVGAITFEFRFRPARQAVRRLIADGAIGQPLHVAFSGQDPRLPQLQAERIGWLGQSEMGGGRLGALGSHMVDSLRYWTGDEVAELSAELTTHVPDGPGGERRDADDAFVVVGRLQGGATFVLDYQSASRRPAGWQLAVHGSQGTIALRDDRAVWLQTGGGGWQEIDLPPAADHPDLPAAARGYASAFLPFLDRLHQSLAGGEATGDLPTFRDGVASQRLLDAVRRSARTGLRQHLQGIDDAPVGT